MRKRRNNIKAMVVDLIIVLALIFANAVFAMGEMAVVSSRKARLKQAADGGARGARLALAMQADPTRFLSSIQIGITIVGTLTGVVGGATLSDPLAVAIDSVPALAGYGEPAALALVVGGLSFLSLLVGELAPKRIALSNPEGIAQALAPFLRGFSMALAPLALSLSAITDLLMRILPKSNSDNPPVTDDEIKILMQEGADAGHFHETERSIVEMALRLGDKRVDALMTPRTRMEVVDLQDPEGENYERILRSHYSRFPVVEGDPGNVLGIIETKNLLESALNGQRRPLRDAIKRALFIPDTAPALRALELFRTSGSPIALVVDEYGDVQGLVTLNDLLEALVGDIATPGLEEEPAYVQREDGSWLIDGMTPFDQVCDLVGLHRPPDSHDAYTTLGGFMMAQLKRIPAAADQAEWRGYVFEVMDMDGRRVDKVMVRRPTAADGEDSL